MYKNELAIVSIKPNLAYGSQGRKPDIPPDSRITYLFGLLHFEKQKEISDMTWAQVILFTNLLKSMTLKDQTPLSLTVLSFF